MFVDKLTCVHANEIKHKLLNPHKSTYKFMLYTNHTLLQAINQIIFMYVRMTGLYDFNLYKRLYTKIKHQIFLAIIAILS